MTLEMLHIDCARTRMPLVCTVISSLVLTVFVAFSFMSWLIETNLSDQHEQGAKSVQVPQLTTSAKNVARAESGGRPGRKF